MHDRHPEPALELLDAADIARGDGGRTGGADIADLALAQRLGEFRLQDVVGARRAAAGMGLGNLRDLESRRLEQSARGTVQLLAMLHRAGGVIGDPHR
jgi:hypothetical protein